MSLSPSSFPATLYGGANLERKIKNCFTSAHLKRGLVVSSSGLNGGVECP
ncbi:hypothetical protein LguiA_015407 [Lonicera macranthoides]